MSVILQASVNSGIVLTLRLLAHIICDHEIQICFGTSKKKWQEIQHKTHLLYIVLNINIAVIHVHRILIQCTELHTILF